MTVGQFMRYAKTIPTLASLHNPLMALAEAQKQGKPDGIRLNGQEVTSIESMAQMFGAMGAKVERG